MSDENRKIENTEIINVSDDRNLGKANVSHEKFNLKSSQIQPFDFERMSGRPTNSENKPSSDSASDSKNS